MSRLRSNEVLNRNADGPFSATEGMEIPAGKNITFSDASEPTVLTGTTLTTTTVNADQINLDDDQRLRIGQDADLQIYHVGLGDVPTIQSDLLVIRAKTGLEDPYITCTYGGSVQLRYAGTPKFETTTSGVAVSGSVTATDGWAGTTSDANVLGGLAMPFTCGLNGRIALPPTNATMLFGGSEYNGDNTEGAAMPHAGKLVAATVHAENAVGNLKLRPTVNGTQQANYEMEIISPTVSSPTKVNTFYSNPLSFSANDRINWAVHNTTLSQLEVLTVTFFVKFD